MINFLHIIECTIEYEYNLRSIVNVAWYYKVPMQMLITIKENKESLRSVICGEPEISHDECYYLPSEHVVFRIGHKAYAMMCCFTSEVMKTLLYRTVILVSTTFFWFHFIKINSCVLWIVIFRCICSVSDLIISCVWPGIHVLLICHV